METGSRAHVTLIVASRHQSSDAFTGLNCWLTVDTALVGLALRDRKHRKRNATPGAGQSPLALCVTFFAIFSVVKVHFFASRCCTLY